MRRSGGGAKALGQASNENMDSPAIDVTAHVVVGASFDNQPQYDGRLVATVSTPYGQVFSASVVCDAGVWSQTIDIGSVGGVVGTYGVYIETRTLPGELVGRYGPFNVDYP